MSWLLCTYTAQALRQYSIMLNFTKSLFDAVTEASPNYHVDCSLSIDLKRACLSSNITGDLPRLQALQTITHGHLSGFKNPLSYYLWLIGFLRQNFFNTPRYSQFPWSFLLPIAKKIKKSVCKWKEK